MSTHLYHRSYFILLCAALFLAGAPLAHAQLNATGAFGGTPAVTGNNSTGTGVYGTSNSTSGKAVYGYASSDHGESHGVHGHSQSTEGFGVYGIATATTGATFGVYGHSKSAIGTGLFGWASDASGYNYGVYALSNSTSGTGVYGLVSSFTGNTYGVAGYVNSTTGTAVYGNAVSSTGANIGVYGVSASDGGIGVKGYATSAGSAGGNTVGIWGRADGLVGRGLSGFAGHATGATRGLTGRVVSPAGWAIYGMGPASPTTGGAAYFSGNVTVTGILTKGGGAFKIDHPQDPTNKYLQHSFVESPDMMNIYNGNIVLDESGEAMVQMPEYFEALNSDFRYTLTPIGAPGPELHISKKMKDRKFRIAGGKPGMEVSWQVTGIRQDATAKAHRIQVVMEKPAGEKGTYLDPVAYGQPIEKGVHYSVMKQDEEMDRLHSAKAASLTSDSSRKGPRNQMN